MPIPFFLKSEQTVRELLVFFFRAVPVVRIGMTAVEEFHYMESTAVDVEMDVTLGLRYALFARFGCFISA